jgi:UDP-3-O-[3-hydroxymyristoyl] glucosamine N-acyltransferase
MNITPATLRSVAALIGAPYTGDDNHLIKGFNEIHRVREGDCVFVDHPKYYDKALRSAASTIIINKEVECPPGKALILHENPFTAFNYLTSHFSPRSYSRQNISSSAVTGENTLIMPGCFIGNNVRIGNNSVLHPNVVVYDNCEIGNNVVIHANTSIGSDAFYFKKRAQNFEPLYSCGIVIIEDEVVIGSNCSIDKGVTDITRIGRGTVIDNHVHIGHDVIIGKMCLFAAQVGIAGACTIGDHVTIWGQAGISSGITIGDNATILAQSGVGENISPGMTFFGSPAGEAKEKMREIFAVKQLPSLIRKLYDQE